MDNNTLPVMLHDRKAILQITNSFFGSRFAVPVYAVFIVTCDLTYLLGIFHLVIESLSYTSHVWLSRHCGLCLKG